MKKQLIVVSDMEGASGIFDRNREWLVNGKEEWREYGRECMTSDVLAVCEAANEFGIDEILYYDGHYAGNPEFNTLLEKLPENVKVFDLPERRFYWRRIRGQADLEPFGIITVGQHARNGEENGYFAHTIQSPPIKGLWLNDVGIAEIGMAVLSFGGVKYIANIGCAASEKEAKELSKEVRHISVKDKKCNWEPSKEETYSIIKEGVLEALKDSHKATGVTMEPPYKFRMEVCKYFYFEEPDCISWKGDFGEREASWEAPSIEMGLELFHYVRSCIRFNEEKRKVFEEEKARGVYNTME